MTVYPTSVVPDLIDALVSLSPAYLPSGALVYDGFGVSMDPGTSYLMVGVENPEASNETYAADYHQKWANTGNLRRDEDGFILCAALAWDGDAVMKDARDAAYAVVGGVENLLRNNPTLGVSNVLWTGFGGRVQLTQNQAQNGAIATVLFRVNFRARL